MVGESLYVSFEGENMANRQCWKEPALQSPPSDEAAALNRMQGGGGRDAAVKLCLSCQLSTMNGKEELFEEDE